MLIFFKQILTVSDLRVNGVHVEEPQAKDSLSIIVTSTVGFQSICRSRVTDSEGT